MRTQITWRGAGDGQLFFIEVDATTREVHGFSNDVTDHPVETGAAITDHVRPKPITLSIDGVISNAPQFLPRDHVQGAQIQLVQYQVQTKGVDSRTTVSGATPKLSNLQLNPPIPGFGVAERLIPIGAAQQVQAGRTISPATYSVSALGFTSEFDRVQDVYDELIYLALTGVVLGVRTKLRLYENMVIQDYNVQRQSGDGESLRFTLDLKQIRTVTTKVEPLPKVPTKRKDKGTQAGKQVPAAAEVDTRSMLFQVNGDDNTQILGE